jgi:hypothetical protein
LSWQRKERGETVPQAPPLPRALNHYSSLSDKVFIWGGGLKIIFKYLGFFGMEIF